MGKDIEHLPLERLGANVGDARTAGAHHDLVAAAGEFERVDLTALLEPPAEGLDHLFAPLAARLLAQPLPLDLGIEQRASGVEVAAAECTEEVDHDRLEILLASARHSSRLLLRSVAQHAQ